MDDQQPIPIPKMGFEGKQAQAQASLGDDLWEMHSAASKIAEFTTGRNFEDYGESEMLRALVRSMLCIMAEALTRLAKPAPEQAAKLDASALLALVERLGTDEAAVPQREVWSFVERSLPELLTRITTELEAWHQG